MKNVFKRTMAMLALVAIVFTNIPVYVFAANTDTTIPTVTISGIASNTVVKKGGSISFKVYFDDENGELSSIYLPNSSVILNGFTATKSVSVTSANVRTVTLSNIQGSGKVNVTIAAGAATDTAGNKSKAVTTRSFTIDPGDITIPTVNISKPNPSTVDVGGTVKYTVYFDDETGVKAVNFNSSYVDIHGFNAKVSVSGSGNEQRIVTLSNIQGAADSDNYITVKAGAVVDTSNNNSKAVNSSKFTITGKGIKDTTIPTVTISKPNPSSIYAGETVKYTVYFDDETKMGTVNFNSSYVDIHGFDANVSVSGSGYTYVVTLSNVKGAADSDNYITVKAGAAQDAAGNKTKAVNSSVFTIKEKDPDPVKPTKDTIPPVVKIGNPNPKAIYAGGTVVYNLTFTDNIKVTDVNLIASKIKLVGFTADVNVKVNGLKSAVVTLKNVKGTVGVNKYIKVDAAVALDGAGNRSAQAISPKFSIIKKTRIKYTAPVATKYTANCIDDLSLLGDINKEITYFASWLRAEKYTASYVQENNYVAEDERMTYMVEYYNGSTAPAPNVKFDLTIPYKVVVEEINGGGRITKQTDTETVITWNVGTVPSYVASRAGGYCRLYVRVRFLENKPLEQSDRISETFYSTLKTTAGGNNSYSYMRQLFIDTTEGKTGTYRSYLTNVDTTNQVRPDDEITRAEFAKLLADSGILDVKVGDNSYKTFKDADKIPAYARDAVSALVKTDIIQAFPDGTFKPENPILMEDAMQMVAQAAVYISVQTSLLIY